ncbi:macro domain-containing protein [Morganella morganii]|uniref:macro domain-containing protein n=1 Tax=Morganella morganii TaxID=582 RepID=UPI003EBA577C
MKLYAKKIGAGQLSVTDEHGRKIINFPTRNKWDSPSGYEFIESGLRELKALIKKQGLKSVAIPALGCGSGGLEWRQVDNLIQTHPGELSDTEIMIYPPVKYIDDSISPHHVLVWWIDNCLLIPSRYNLYIAIYILQRLNGMNLFNFSGTISTLYSDDVDRYVNDLRDRIAHYGIDFNTVIDVQIKLNREHPENPLPAMMIDGLLQGKAIKEITTILRDRYQARDIDFVLFRAKNSGLLKDNILGDVILTR